MAGLVRGIEDEQNRKTYEARRTNESSKTRRKSGDLGDCILSALFPLRVGPIRALPGYLESSARRASSDLKQRAGKSLAIGRCCVREEREPTA